MESTRVCFETWFTVPSQYRNVVRLHGTVKSSPEPQKSKTRSYSVKYSRKSSQYSNGGKGNQ